MPDGSSSAAPVIMPGPKMLRNFRRRDGLSSFPACGGGVVEAGSRWGDGVMRRKNRIRKQGKFRSTRTYYGWEKRLIACSHNSDDARFKLNATITALNPNASSPCIKAMRRTRRDVICTSEVWQVMPMTKEK